MVREIDKKRDIIVIGAGASGMMAAITASRKGADVLVLEKMNTPGKKILATGNGRCNMTNMEAENHCYFHDKDFARKVINKFNVKKTLDFFREIGLLHKVEGEGRVYPYSEQAKSVVDVLEMEMKRLHIEMITNCPVVKIRRESSGFLLYTKDGKVLQSRNVILATGGKSGAKYGSAGDGYLLARELGHTINNPKPSLVQVLHHYDFGKVIKGVRAKGEVSLQIDGKTVAKEEGEIQFTERGLSGICIFNLSRNIEACKQNKESIIIDLFPSYTDEVLERLLFKRLETAYDKSIEEYMIGMINKKLIPVILKLAKIKNIERKACSLNEKNIEQLVKVLKAWAINIQEVESFDHSQVTSGGIITDEIDADSLESKLVKNLYFAGEIVDIDGLCGGYNLQWAWSSGYVAGGSYDQD